MTPDETNVEFAYTDSNGDEREPTPDELQKNPITYGSDGKRHVPRRQRKSYWNVIYILIFGPFGFFSVSSLIGILISIGFLGFMGSHLLSVSTTFDPIYAATFYVFTQIILIPIFIIYIVINNQLVESRRVRVANRTRNMQRKKKRSERVDTATIKAEAKAEIQKRTANVVDGTDQLVGKTLKSILDVVKK